MAAPSEVQAAIIMVSGDWARHLATTEPEHREGTLAVLLEQYTTICKTLKTMHEDTSRPNF
jgi:hypothetical protein